MSFSHDIKATKELAALPTILSTMATLLAQAASSAEWHQGWQLALAVSGVAITLVLSIVGWFYRILKADINRLDHRIDRLEAKIDDLQQIILKDALERARLLQATPAAAPQPVASQSEAVPQTATPPQARVSDLGFIAPTAEHSEKQ